MAWKQEQEFGTDLLQRPLYEVYIKETEGEKTKIELGYFVDARNDRLEIAQNPILTKGNREEGSKLTATVLTIPQGEILSYKQYVQKD